MAGFFGSVGKKWQQIENIDKTLAAFFLSSAQSAAIEAVKELQERGPSWTGEFSNSWQIETRTPGLEWRGTMEPGEPVPPPDDASAGPGVTMQDARDALERGKIIFKISNVSPLNKSGEQYAEFAADRKKGEFSGKWEGSVPQTSHGKSKLESAPTKRNVPAKRGAIGGSSVEGGSSRTAEEDWLDNYLNNELAYTIEKQIKFTLKGR